MDGHDVQLVGLRFTGLNIPPGARILSASVQFTVDETNNEDPCELQIYGEASGDAPPFTNDDFNLSGRPRTTAFTSWQPPAWENVNEAAAAQRTPDLSAVLQEVVDRDDYKEGGAIVLLIGGRGKRVAESFDGTAGPQLCVDYRLTIPEICDDGADNDGDGLVDCNDPDCVAFEDCLISCNGGCVTIGDDSEGDYCFYWTPAELINGPNDLVKVEVCPETTTTFNRTAVKPNGELEIEEYVVTVLPKGELVIVPEHPVFCSDPVLLEASEGFVNYVWTDADGGILGEGPLYWAPAPGIYVVNARQENGCEVSAAVTVAASFEVEISPETAGVCIDAADPATLDAGGGYESYAWYVGGQEAPVATTQVLQAFEPGRYRVEVVNVEGCRATAEREVGDAGDPAFIKQRFLNAGFFSTPVEVLGDDLEKTLLGDLIDDYAEKRIKIVDDDFNIAAELEDLLSDPLFEGIAAGAKHGFITKNENVCDQALMAEIEASFEQNELAWWIHVFDMPDSAEDCLLIRVNIPFSEEHGPVSPEHRAYVAASRDLVLNRGSIYDYRSQDERAAENLLIDLADVKVSYDIPAVDEDNGLSIQVNGDCLFPSKESVIALNPAGIPIQLPQKGIPRFRIQKRLQGQIAREALSGFVDAAPPGNPEYEIYEGFRDGKTGEQFVYYREKFSGRKYSYLPVTTGELHRIMLGYTLEQNCEGTLWYPRAAPFLSAPPYGAGPLRVRFDSEVFEIPILDFEDGQQQLLSNITINFCPPRVWAQALENPLALRLIKYDNDDFGIRYVVESSDGPLDLVAQLDNDGQFVYYYWECNLGEWIAFDAPDYYRLDVVSDMLVVLSSEAHTTLNIAGFFPGVDIVADFLQAALYYIEGDKVEAKITAALALIPLANEARRAGDFIQQGAKWVWAPTIDGKQRVVRAITRQVVENGAPRTAVINIENLIDELHKVGLNPQGRQELIGWLWQEGNGSVLKRFAEEKELVGAWAKLYNAGSRHVVKDPILLENFHKLNADAQDYVKLFSDNGPGSTLGDFLSDLDDEFLDFVNTHKNITEGFVGHKLDEFDDVKFEDLAEELDDIDALAQAKNKAIKWLDRSAKIQALKNVFQLGKSLSDNIIASIRQQGPMFDAVKDKLNIPDLDSYEVFDEVPLTTAGGFMKADAVLIKKNPVTDEIEDVIIIENKLSQGTRLTERQREGFSKIRDSVEQPVEMVVHYNYRIFGTGDILPVSKGKCLKIAGHGTDDISTITPTDIKNITEFNF
jgi:hypothetical protein